MSDHTKCCVDCKATRTPLWRTGPAGPRSLCNACGIRYRKRKASSRSNTRTTPKINDVTQLQHLFSTDKDHHHHHQSSCIYSSTSYSGSTGSSTTTTTSAAVVVDDNNTNTTTSVGNQEEFNTKVVPFVGFKKKGSGFDLNNQNINRHSSDDDEEFRRRKRREWRSRRRKMGEVEEAAVLLMSLSYGAPHICLKF